MSHNGDIAKRGWDTEAPAADTAVPGLDARTPAHAPPRSPMQHGIGNPAPLGLLAFGMTTCFLMFVTTGWAEAGTLATVVTFAIAFGGVAQMWAGIASLLKGNTFAGTAFFSYGAFWVAFFVTKYLAATSTLLTGSAAGFPSAAKYQVGETLIMAFWSLFTFCFFVPTLRKNGCLMTVFGTLTLTFALLAGGQWSARCNTAAGYVGFLCGCSAIYTAVAEIWHEDLGIMMPGLRPVRFI